MGTFFVTGGAGFIGSHLVDALLKRGKVIVYDNFSLGKRENLAQHKDNADLSIVEADLLDLDKVIKTMEGCDTVFHLAANSDISNHERTDIDLTQGTIATYNVLEAMRINNISKIIFSSTSAVYGTAIGTVTSEDYGPLQPISFYGASKLACEALISAFCHNFGFRAWVYRFGNITGERGTHGILVDFVRKLTENPKELEILGDGKQAKPYVEVKDLISGILYGFDHAKDDFNCFNLTSEGNSSVMFIADAIVETMGLKDVAYKFTGGSQGWKGDVPNVLLETKKMAALGWKTKYSSDEAVKKAAKDYISTSITNTRNEVGQ